MVSYILITWCMNRPWSKVFEVSVENNCAFSVSSWAIFSGVGYNEKARKYSVVKCAVPAPTKFANLQHPWNSTPSHPYEALAVFLVWNQTQKYKLSEVKNCLCEIFDCRPKLHRHPRPPLNRRCRRRPPRAQLLHHLQHRRVGAKPHWNPLRSTARPCRSAVRGMFKDTFIQDEYMKDSLLH